MATRLFVGNISAGVCEDDLQKEFSFYGKVVGVDLKRKRDANDVGNESQFAFVTLDTDNLNINKCIQEFSEQKWKGSFLNVTIAKESFLDRLKRERTEAEKPKEEKILPKVIEKINIPIPSKINISIPSKVNIPTPVKNSNSFIKDTSKTSYSEKKEKHKTFENDHDEDFSPKRRKTFNDNNYSLEPNNVNGFKQKTQNGSKDKTYNEESLQEQGNTNLSNKKRLESIQNMKNTYNEKKSLIKMALSGIDCKKNNKIVFGDDENVNVVNKRGIKNNEKNNSKNGKQHNKTKSALFDEESDENDEETYNFDIKQQFEGESGRKLLELQSRYQSDKRFTLDKRFLEDNVENNIENDAHISDKHIKYENDYENNDDVDIINEEEKIRQAEILKGIIGDSGVVNKSENTKKLPLKTMLRFDPSRSDHDKFLNKPIEKPALSKKAKREKKKLEQEHLNEKQRPNDAPAPIVSEERYYKINEPLKQSSEDNQPFSLLSLFGNRDVEENAMSKDEEYSTKPIEKSNNKVKNPLNGEKNPFFYDSSDSEGESKKKRENEKSEPADVLKEESKPTTIVENFFFSDIDPRFLEGLEFFFDAKPRSDKTRHELKSIVKKRIKNNLRNSNKFHSKKVARSSKAKFKR